MGNTIILSNYRNKNYVLLDFWASWCLPCLKEIPQIKELHNVYERKGLKIIGVSLDEDETIWVNTINKNQIGIWTQISNFDERDNIAERYKIEIIPAYILIDKEGRIVARWQHIDKEEMSFIDNTIKN